jgi:energy-coupling factor transporter ATP-binding protein EcfA2
MFTYQAFGFVLESDLQFSELEETSGIAADIKIRKNEIEVPAEWLNNKGLRTKASKSEILIGVSDLVNFRIIEGKQFYYHPLKAFHFGKARLYILGIGFSAIIHQRGLLPLHASSLVKNGKALLICGESGAGKSTTAAALLQQGFRLLADDITVIRISGQNAFAYPGFPHMKLWPESAEMLGIENEQLIEFAPDISKRGMSVRETFQQHAVEISAIVFITKDGSELQFNLLSGAEKAKILINNTFRLRFVRDTEQFTNYFGLITQTGNACKMMSITRPDNRNTINEIIDNIQNFFNTVL